MTEEREIRIGFAVDSAGVAVEYGFRQRILRGWSGHVLRVGPPIPFPAAA